MKLVITIKLENDALTSDLAVYDINRMLEEASMRLDSIGLLHEPCKLFNLRDIDGNTVGTVELAGDDEQ